MPTVNGFLLLAILFSQATYGRQAPSSLALGSSDFSTKSLGNVCYAIDAGTTGLPCNPAFTAQETPANFRSQLFWGGNAAHLQDVASLLQDNGDSESARRLFSQRSPEQMEASLDFSYRRPVFAFAVVPLKVVYYSFIRNQALPTVTLLASQEQSVRAQIAGYAGEDWSWGFQLRGVHRTFIGKTFTVTDALSEQRSEIFAPEKQDVLYIEPGVLKEWQDVPLQPQLTINFSGWGLVSHKYRDYPAEPELHFGSALTMPVQFSRWQVGVDYALDSDIQKLNNSIRLGSSLDVGISTISGSFGASDYALGAQFKGQIWSSSLTHTARLIEDWSGDSEWIRILFFQIGFDF